MIGSSKRLVAGCYDKRFGWLRVVICLGHKTPWGLYIHMCSRSAASLNRQRQQRHAAVNILCYWSKYMVGVDLAMLKGLDGCVRFPIVAFNRFVMFTATLI